MVSLLDIGIGDLGFELTGRSNTMPPRENQDRARPVLEPSSARCRGVRWRRRRNTIPRNLVDKALVS